MPITVSQGLSPMSPNVLVLGGTTEAAALARALDARRVRATLALAGRTLAPADQSLPVRIGGFGGPDGLARWLHDTGTTHLVDATHPFAARISANAVDAAARTGTPLIALTRPPWRPEPGDRWHEVPDMAAAAAALDGPPMRVFLAIGRQELHAFAHRTQHSYLLRMVDAPAAPPPLPGAALVLARGPFRVEGDLALMRAHGIDCVVTKNSGGSGASAKLAAARSLGARVIMVARPHMPARREASSVQDVLHWLGSATAAPADRGV